MVSTHHSGSLHPPITKLKIGEEICYQPKHTNDGDFGFGRVVSFDDYTICITWDDETALGESFAVIDFIKRGQLRPELTDAGSN